MKVLTKLCFLVGFLLVIQGVSAQSLSFGGKLGVNIANMEFSEDGLTIEPDSKMGLNIAAILNVGLTDAFSVQPEVNFIQKGYTLDFELFDETVESDFIINYLEVPVLGKYSFGTDQLMGFVEAGPTVGFAMSAKTVTDGDSEDIDFDEDGLKRLDFGLISVSLWVPELDMTLAWASCFWMSGICWALLM